MRLVLCQTRWRVFVVRKLCIRDARIESNDEPLFYVWLKKWVQFVDFELYPLVEAYSDPRHSYLQPRQQTVTYQWLAV
jgi:hypothetical protein